ncbi:ral guanine nucleotide dissociation stimulator-like [Dipodomys merriami]|uniref:ral guanine nucleotide dissociation stimulator-like n=1 Tax=Dipodomys merriami TaxID=94247 RepID=UPI0038556E72
MLVMNLVPAYQKGNLFYVGNYLHNYRLWGTMQQVLDIVFKKYRFPGRNSEEDEQERTPFVPSSPCGWTAILQISESPRTDTQ